MRSPLYVATIAATLFGAPATAKPTDSSCNRQSILMANSIMARGQGIMTGAGGSSEALQAGFVQKAFTQLANHYTSVAPKYDAYVQKSAQSATLFLSNASYNALTYPMDRLSNGNALWELSAAKRLSPLHITAEALRASITLNRRNSEGGLWYYVYPYWSYLDGMFSLGPFYALYTLTAPSDPKTVSDTLNDLLYQFDILWQHTRHAATGLLVHGYDATRSAVWADRKTGASPHVWGRSLAWYTMALVNTIEILQQNKAAPHFSAPLLEKYHTLMPAVLKAVDQKTGGWWQLVDQPGKKGNYIESSGTAMFSYSLLKGARLGYLPKPMVAEATKVALRAQKYLTKTFVVKEADGTLGYNGTVAVCSLNSTATFDYYVNQPILYNSVLGSAAYIIASLEAESL